MSTKITLSTEEIRRRVELRAKQGEISGVDLRAIERFLARKEYREEYNARPEVKARRKEYARERREEEKRVRAQIALLEKEIAKRRSQEK